MINSMIFSFILYSIKLILKELIPCIKFALLIISYIKPIFFVGLLFLLVEIMVITFKKSKKFVCINNNDSNSTKKVETSKPTICSECGKEVNSNLKTCPYCGKQLQQTNLALIFTGISLLINPICIFSILGIIFGIIQLTNNDDNKTEKSWTIFSIILSILTTLSWIFILRNKFRLIMCLSF